MSEPAQPIAYFDNTFAEAVALACDARDYVTFQGPADLLKLSPTGRIAASCESMRLTSRVAQVIAWLLVQKAVHAGELEREEAAQPRYRLGGRNVCGQSEPVADEPLPERLAELLERSHRLYQRVARLDAMLEPERP
ncbi:MAG: DUF1465 family protein [Kiloniellaceae bacterium]